MLVGMFEIALRALLVSVALFAAAHSFMWARAQALFNQRTLGSVRRAAQLVPSNPLYAQALADSAADDHEKIARLRHAIELNPYDSKSWIDLGFEAELRQNDTRSAEYNFLKAAQVDHMYMPRWTLANFYFRQGRPDSYFKWAPQALSITPYDPTPILDQIWSISQDSTRNLAAIPDQYRALYLYLAFLISTNRFAFIAPAAERAIQAPIIQPEIAPLSEDRANILGVTVDQLLLRGDRPAALSLWSSMRRASVVTLPQPTEEQPLSNSDFAKPFLEHGFDWKAVPVRGVTVDRLFGASEVRFLFNGSEPESCALLQQFIPVREGSRYRITWEATTNEGVKPPGIEWHLYAIFGDKPPADIGTGQQAFEIPRSVDSAILSLEYRRPLGQTRLEGTLLLRRVALKPL